MADESYIKALQPAIRAMQVLLEEQARSAREVAASQRALEGAQWDETTRIVMRRLELIEDAIGRSSDVLMALFDMHARLAGVDPEKAPPHLRLVKSDEE